MSDPRVHITIGLYTLAHLIVAALLPLAPHEIHYSSYAQNLALSYLDHPPLAAWLQAPVVALSTAAFSVRLLPIALATLTQYLLVALARRILPDGPANLELLAVLILQGTLVFHGAMTLTPDAPLLAAGLAVALATCRALEKDRYRDWLLLGVLLGIAGLSKYTAVTLAFSVALLAMFARGPGVLFSGRLWLTAAICLLVISPVLIWNLQQDWITVRFHSDYQFDVEGRWSALALLGSVSTQITLYSPLLVLGGLTALAGGLRQAIGEPGRNWRQLLAPVFALPPLLTFLVAVLESRASPHWSVLGWLFLIPSTALWVLNGWQRLTVKVLAGVSAAYSLVVIVALVVILLPVGRWPDYAHPIKLVTGWPETTERALKLLDELDTSGKATPPEVLARNWHHIPIIEWYAPGVSVKSLFRDLNPYNLKNGLADHQTWGVLVYPGERDVPRDIEWLTYDFACTPIDQLVLERQGSKLQTIHYYRCDSQLPETASGTVTP